MKAIGRILNFTGYVGMGFLLRQHGFELSQIWPFVVCMLLNTIGVMMQGD